MIHYLDLNQPMEQMGYAEYIDDLEWHHFSMNSMDYSAMMLKIDNFMHY